MLLGFGSCPGTREGVWHQKGSRNRMRASRNSQQLSPRASTFCPKSSEFFAFLKNKFPRADTRLAHVCVKQPAAPLPCRVRGGAKGRQLPPNPCLHRGSLAGWKRGAGRAWGQEPAAEGLLYQGSAAKAGIACHPVSDHGRRCPAPSDGQTIWKAPELPPKPTGSTGTWHREKKGLDGAFSMATGNACGANG